MSVQEGWAFAIITGALGVFILGNYFNWLTAGLAAFSLFLYAFIYTPLKKVNSIAVLIGAVPGALPCLIGWAAGEGQLITGWLDTVCVTILLAVSAFLGYCLGGA